MRWRTSWLFVAAAVVLAGCGAGDDAADVAESTVAEAQTPVDDGSGGDATSTEVGDDASSQPTAGPQPPAVESVAVVEQPLLPGLDEMTLLSAADGGGSRPLLAWEPVGDASFYSVVVYDPGGAAYWGSFVDTTETFVGGPEPIDDDKPGPRVVAGMSWSVVALDRDLVPVAASGIRPLSP